MRAINGNTLTGPRAVLAKSNAITADIVMLQAITRSLF